MAKMLEVYGDIWKYKADAKCITTNGYVRTDGRAVMGRGVALQATKRYPDIALVLGSAIRDNGLHVQILGETDDDGWLVSFPVKYHWREKADLELIKDSALELIELTDVQNWNTVVLPKPGCGNGQLHWKDVKSVLKHLLDDRFHIIDYEKEA